jgi:regulator of RNase E activity RraA
MSTEELIPLDGSVFEILSKVSTATLATQLYRKGIRQPFLVGLSPVGDGFTGFVGEAFTMRFIPAREDIDPLDDPYRTGNVLQWEAVEAVGPGQVIVVDSRSDVTAASAGDMLITRAMLRGASGFVTDGAFRDGAAIADLGFPTYARGITATTRPASFHVADLQVPIGCAGVAVYPGDVLVGDRDGIIVIPRALAAEIAQPSLEQEDLEQWLHSKVKAGAELWGTYPPSDETRREYAEWKQAQLAETNGVSA